MADDNKIYAINVDPSILKLLGPNLYTNIYYVLAELIANAWDADANNVYIIKKHNKLIIEDDGKGMSYSRGEIQKYLSVAQETRKTAEDSTTRSGRIKMGRKGIGKLSALAVSENVKVMTVSNGEKSGFILTRNIPEGGNLSPINDGDIDFIHINDNGTSIIMENPEYELSNDLNVVKRNLVKMFPIISSDFKIHIESGKNKVCIDSFDTNVIKDLSCLITVGDDYKHLSEYTDFEVVDDKNRLLRQDDTYEEDILLTNVTGIDENFRLKIEGWIGTYKTTKNRKNSVAEFPENHISIFANGKLGEFNILPKISQNKLPEVYVVGELHVDLFEETCLPDMALSNRQGYKEDDPRYANMLLYASKLLNDIINIRNIWVSLKNKDSEEKKYKKKTELEEKFNSDVNKYEDKVSKDVVDVLNKSISSPEEINIQAIKKVIEKNRKILGLKPKISSNKKRILISQTRDDKDLADVIYNMLIFNGVPIEDILYTNSEDEAARIPENVEIYEYLRQFFVRSVSDDKLAVIFVTSENMSKSWGAVVEVGANWITQYEYKIFNLDGYKPQHPLDDNLQWHQSYHDEVNKDLCMDSVNADIFYTKLNDLLTKMGYPTKSHDENIEKLKTLVKVI